MTAAISFNGFNFSLIARQYIHKDVGKRGPVAFCNGVEWGLLCTDEWLSVTCPCCHEQRHDRSPLSAGELFEGVRATGPGTRRPLTSGEASATLSRSVALSRAR